MRRAGRGHHQHLTPHSNDASLQHRRGHQEPTSPSSASQPPTRAEASRNRKLCSGASEATAIAVGAGGAAAESVEECETSNEDGNAERLEELRIGIEEAELCEEQLRSNSQAQEDELLVMESIYGDNVSKCEPQNGLLSFQVHIDVDIPTGITVNTKLNSSVDPETTRGGHPRSFKVWYLPPIVLSCLSPKSYPSKLPPYFTLSSGQEVIYRWAEWLSSSSLSYLELENEVILGPYDVKYTESRRVISGSVSPDFDAPYIRSYNDERLRESFVQNLHECCICFSEYVGIKFARLPCDHFFCWNCMKTYSDMHVAEGTVNKLQCPEPKCGGAVPPSLLKQLLSHEEYVRWETLTLKKTLDSMSDVTYCPRCETPCIGEDDGHAQCTQCFFSFCTLCREQRHVGSECMTPEMKLQKLQELYLKEGERRKELEKFNEMLTVKEILRNAKQCPYCKMAISKISGCNRMVCTNCCQPFWYGSSEEERINPRQVIGQIHAEMFAEQGQGQLCPNCRQFNAKVGNNNHLFCWACQVHYCYLCKKTVRRSSQHYGPRGCKQHSVG